MVTCLKFLIGLFNQKKKNKQRNIICTWPFGGWQSFWHDFSTVGTWISLAMRSLIETDTVLKSDNLIGENTVISILLSF